MKSKLIAAFFALYYAASGGVCVGLLTSGCTTVNGERVADIPRLTRLAGDAAQIGSTIWLKQHPDSRPEFVASYNALGALNAVGNYDPAAFASALAMLPLRELQGPNGNIYIMTFVILWDDIAQQAISLDSTTWVKPLLVAVRGGLGKALGVTPGVRSKGFIP